MTAILRVHGLPWAEFDVVENALGKTVSLMMRKDGQLSELLTFTSINGQLIYSAGNHQAVLGGVRTEGKEGAEHAKTPKP